MCLTSYTSMTSKLLFIRKTHVCFIRSLWYNIRVCGSAYICYMYHKIFVELLKQCFPRKKSTLVILVRLSKKELPYDRKQVALFLYNGINNFIITILSQSL